jgi:RNA polymerase sigma-70 factor (sigma-E family)
VNTVVDTQSTAAVRGSPAADPVLASSTAGLLDAPTADLVIRNGRPAGDAALADGLDGAAQQAEGAQAVAEAEQAEAEAEQADVPDAAADASASDGHSPAASEDTTVSEDNAGSERGQGDVQGNSVKCVNLDTDGEPSEDDRRPTGVTATLSETAVLPEIAPADEALAPDTSATSAFDAEERRKPAVWAAADVVTEIYLGHYHSLVRLAVLLVHDVQTAEEVVQDAFEAMHLASRRLRDSERALQYLRQTVVNKSRSVLRHRKVVDMHAPKPAPDEPSAEHAALAILERSAVAAALRSLPERQREAIALRYYADFSEADIARAMGISKGAVKSHTARAMASLKAMLSQETS